jgi:hypothetical protein
MRRLINCLCATSDEAPVHGQENVTAIFATRVLVPAIA